MLRALIHGLLLAIGIIPLASAAKPQGPSFDCAKAANPVEHAICGNPSLSASDLALSQHYNAALAVAGRYRDDLVAFERAWLKRRGPECGLTLSGPVQQPDISDRTHCLLDLITRRAKSLEPPYYGYGAQDTRVPRGKPPLTLWLLNEAFAEMPFAPQAAERVFVSIVSVPAHLGHLMTARLFDPPSAANTKLQQALARQLSEESKGDRYLPVPIPEAYDGSISGLVSYMQFAGVGLSFPCKLFARFPDLIRATGAEFGSSADNFVPLAVCSDYEYPYPHSAAVLSASAAPYDGGAFGRCTGTVRYTDFAQDRMYELISRTSPKTLLQPGIDPRRFWPATGVVFPAVPRNIPLESWSYQSVWNRHAFAAFRPGFEKAMADFTSMYETRWGFSPRDAAHAAHVALWLPLLWTSDAPPPKPIALAIISSDATRALQPFVSGKLPETGMGEPLLSLAIETPGAMRLLLSDGANVNAVNDFGKTPLMTAAQFDKVGAVSLLIAAGASVNEQSFAPGRIPHNDAQAGEAGDVGCEAYHILHGSRTALIYAAANASLAIIRELLAAGADKTLKDSLGLTALDYLRGKGPVPANPRLDSADRSEATKLLMFH